MPPPRNRWVKGCGWFGPSYPEAGDPPASGATTRPVLPSPTPVPASAPAAPTEPAPAAAPGGVEPPPRGGAGSARPVWLAYARANRVDVTDDADRDTIIDACRQAGVPVD